MNVASGDEISILEIGRTILAILGKGQLDFVHYEERPGDIRRQWADISLAHEQFGFQAKVAIRQGLEDQIRWMQDQRIDWKAVLRKDRLHNWETLPEPNRSN